MRRQRHIPLSSCPVPSSTLSKFERGDTMISFDRLLDVLDVLGISLEELDLLLNGTNVSSHLFIMQEIDKIIVTQNFYMLPDLMNELKDNNFTYLAIGAQSIINPLNDLEQEKLLDYFYSLNFWFLSDLWMFGLTLKNFSVHEILYLVEEIVKQSALILCSSNYKFFLVRALCEVSKHLTYLNQKEYSEYVLQKIETKKLISATLHSSMFLQNLYNLTYGYWIEKFQNHDIGKTTMDDALNIFSKLEPEEISNYYRREFDSQ